jgi:hypothetical protein
MSRLNFSASHFRLAACCYLTARMIFGLPDRHTKMVEAIVPNETLLFLFNYR